MKEMTETTNTRENARAKRRLLLILALAAAVALGVWIGAQTSGAISPIDDALIYTIDGAAVPLDSGARAKPDAIGEQIKIPGYGQIQLTADKADVALLLANPDDNPCYFVYEIVLTETDETLYASQLITPGSAVEQITLNRPLTKGKYPAVIKVHTYALESRAQLNGADLKTLLVVS